MDQLAIPSKDFVPGGMENWGLATYSEHLIFHNEKADPASQRYNTVRIISHEYAHQYFGDLISPIWWSYLWLNEGFATLYGSWLMRERYPELDADGQYFLASYQVAMMMDGLGATRPMTHYGESRREISNLFDVVAYDKGK